MVCLLIGNYQKITKMKNALTSFVLTVCFSVACVSSSFGQGYSLKLRVKGLKDTTCYLAYHYGDKQYLKDTAAVDKNGYFTFEGKEALPGGIYMAVLPDKRYFEIIVTEQSFSMETDTSDYIMGMKVKGSEENKLFYDYLQFLNPRGMAIDSLQKQFANAKNKSDSTALKDKITALNQEIVNYKKNVIQTHPKTFVAKIFKAMEPIEPTKEQEEEAKAKGDSLFRYKFYKAHFLDNIDFTDDRILRTPIFHQKIKEYITNLTLQHVDSINKEADYLVSKAKANKELFKYTVWYITTSYETSNLMGADAVFVHMVEKYYMTKQAYWVDSSALAKITERAMILKPLLIGKKAPNLYLEDTLGNYYNLHSLKAKYTIVYFWDPSCGHCQKATPKLYDVYKKYKNDGVQVYAVNIDRDLKEWTKFIKDHQLQWINVYDPHYRISFKHLYDIYSTPVIYILNDKKEIVAKRISWEQVDELLGNFLKKKDQIK